MIRSALVLLIAAAGCTSYEMTLVPEAIELQPRPVELRGAITLSVDASYAPYAAGALDLDDRYPRDGILGEKQEWYYREAFERSEQFSDVALGEPGSGLHCHLSVVSGREPNNELRRVLSILLTAGLLPNRRDELLLLDATVSRPGRASATYRIEARITVDDTSAEGSGMHRPYREPEAEIVRALVARMAADGWLEPDDPGARRGAGGP